MSGKRFWGKVTSRLCRYPLGQKFCRNRSTSLCYRDKCIFAFYAEIQDGRQKWRENDFWEKSPVDCRYPVGQNFHRNRSSLLLFRDKRVFAFYTEIQHGRKKWRENDFSENVPDSADTVGVKNFIGIALARSVSEINVFLRFTQKFMMAAKSSRKTILV